MTDIRANLEESLSGLTVERELGGGGMSRVFVARDQVLKRSIVVKMLPPDVSGGVSIERFRREIELAARLQHPHIVPVLTAGDAGGTPYFTMQFVEGESLRDRLAREGPLPIRDTIEILREIADALAYAHARGVVHRDIKPANILLAGRHAQVADFGIAKALLGARDHGSDVRPADTTQPESLTIVGAPLGTPGYMAPEQITAEPRADHRMDIYSLGILAYEMLTGELPFSGRSAFQLMSAHVTDAPAPVSSKRKDIPPALAALVMRCLAKNPDDRPQDAIELGRALEEIVYAPATTRTPRKALVAGSGLTLFALLSAGYMFIPADKKAQAKTLATRAPAQLVPNRVVVEPLHNETGDSTLDRLGTYVQQRLSVDLTRLRQLTVVSGREADVAAKFVERLPWWTRAFGRTRALANETGASVVVTGAYYREGSTLRFVTAIRDFGADAYRQPIPEVTGPVDSYLPAIAQLSEHLLATFKQASDTSMSLGFGAAGFSSKPEAVDEMVKGFEGFMVQDSGWMTHLRAAERMDSGYTTAVLLQGMGIWRNQFALAAAALNRSERLRTRMTPAEEALFRHLKAHLAGQVDESLQTAREIMALLPADPDAPLLLAGTALEAEDPALADSELDRLQPDRGLNFVSPYYWRHRTVAAHELGHHDRALAHIEQGLRRHPHLVDYEQIRVQELVDLNRLDEARAAPERGPDLASQLSIAIATAEALWMSSHRDAASAVAVEWLRRSDGAPPCDQTKSAARREGVVACLETDRARLFSIGGQWDSVRVYSTRLAQRDTGLAHWWDLSLVGAAAAHLGDRRTLAAADSELTTGKDRYTYGYEEWMRGRIAAQAGDLDGAMRHLQVALHRGLHLQFTEWPFDKDQWLSSLLGRKDFDALKHLR